MQFVRRSFLTIFGAALPLLLLATAFNFGVLQVIGSPEPVKKILSGSGIYNSVVGTALEQAKTTSSGTSEVSLNDPTIKKAAQESFSPDVVKNSSEKVVDGIYVWLDGKSPQPQFDIDLSNAKNDFADKVGEAAKTKAATLPVCTSAPTTTDPFSATCVPPGVTPEQIGDQAKNDVLKGQGFLEHPKITASSFKSASGNHSLFEGKLKGAPKKYQLAKKTPYILAGLTILAMLAIVFLSTTRRKGLRRVGVILAIVGVFMLAFAWGLNRVVTQNITPKIVVENKVLQSNMRNLATDITHRVDRNYWIFGIVYAALGLILILTTLFVGRNRSKKSPAATKAQAVNQTPQNNPVPSQQPRPAPPRRKSPPRIQG
jgi:hypothetical protein